MKNILHREFFKLQEQKDFGKMHWCASGLVSLINSMQIGFFFFAHQNMSLPMQLIVVPLHPLQKGKENCLSMSNSCSWRYFYGKMQETINNLSKNVKFITPYLLFKHFIHFIMTRSFSVKVKPHNTSVLLTSGSCRNKEKMKPWILWTKQKKSPGLKKKNHRTLSFTLKADSWQKKKNRNVWVFH